MNWLMSGPSPDWIAQEPDKQFGNVAEAFVVHASR
jgi:hypothetical protein